MSSMELGHSDGLPGEWTCGFVGDWDPSLAGLVGGEDRTSRKETCGEVAREMNRSEECTGDDRRWERFGERERRGR